jgi:Protein of unknown function (DUF3185)/Family of unknown function (DUF5670)
MKKRFESTHKNEYVGLVRQSACGRMRRTLNPIKKGSDIVMLYTLAFVLIVLWLLGLVSSYTMGGFIHVLLVIAVVVILLRVISGRRVVWRFVNLDANCRGVLPIAVRFQASACPLLADNVIYGLLPAALRRNRKNLKENPMNTNKLISLAILAGGIVLVVFGVAATDSFSSDVSRFFTGSPTDKAIWMLIGGIVAIITGLGGLSLGKPKGIWMLR